jgi:multicomponent Na+:H+ antiporter subunit C
VTTFTLYSTVGACLWVLGLAGLLLVKSMLRRIIAVNIMSSGVFLVLVAQTSLRQANDPILQALVVTGLVVAVSATALALRLNNALGAAAGTRGSGDSQPQCPALREDNPE